MFIPISHHHPRHRPAPGGGQGGRREVAIATALASTIVGGIITLAVSVSPELVGSEKAVAIGLELAVVGALVGFALGRVIGRQGKI